MPVLGIPANVITTNDPPDPPRRVLVELRSQLQHWRLLLPPELQWPDNRRHELSSPPQNAARTVCSFNLDILVAQLRARFYSARFISGFTSP
jgi:hypothetical protein